MRFYLGLFFCVSVFFISCGGDKKIPGDITPIHKMAALLTDIHIVDGSLYDINQMPDSLSKHGLGMYVAVFKMHQIDTLTFKRSIEYYSTHPVLLNQIYVGIEQRIQKKIDSLQNHKPKVNADSLAKVNLAKRTDSTKKAVKDKAKIDSLQKALKQPQDKPKKLIKFKLLPHAIPQ